MGMSAKVVIVTGAGQGIGKATAKAFAAEHASVVTVDINASTGKATVDDIERDGGKAGFIRADVSDAADVRRMADQAMDEFGRIDVLVNVAGVQGMVADVVELPENEWYRVLNTNISSVYLCSKYCLPYMIENGGGSIVNVASMQSYFNMPGSSAYAAAKGGIVSLTRSMALDFARRNVRVNAVAPGYIDTPLLRGFARATGDEQGTIDGWERRIPIGRLQQPEEVAQVILFLASEKASAVTGVTLSDRRRHHDGPADVGRRVTLSHWSFPLATDALACALGHLSGLCSLNLTPDGALFDLIAL